jgi:hypothetical protein
MSDPALTLLTWPERWVLEWSGAKGSQRRRIEASSSRCCASQSDWETSLSLQTFG